MDGPEQPGPDDEEWAKTKVQADIAQMKNVVEDATVKEVDTPSGRKDVEIAWEDEDGFHVEDGRAIGVYRDYSNAERLTAQPELQRLHVDWADGRSRTTVSEDELETLEEGDWYFPNKS